MMIEYIHSENGAIYDQVADGFISVSQGCEEFAKLYKHLIAKEVDAVSVMVLAEIDSAWRNLKERDFIKSYF
jgi:hypothetical protein